MKILLILQFILLLQSCNDNPGKQGEWIKGNEEEKIKIIEKQFRGFDNAMVETDYRYQELYWAGRDENWDYAAYQLEKIKIAIETGLERRPKRAKSAEYFLNTILPEMKKSVDSRDTGLFTKNFQVLTMNCNSCHAKENLSFFTVKAPLVRQSSIRN